MATNKTMGYPINSDRNSIDLSALVILGIALISFHNIAIYLFSYRSRYDLTCFILLLYALFTKFDKKHFSMALVILIGSFTAIEFAKQIYYQIAPVHRVFSGIVWLSGLLIIYIKRQSLTYNHKHVFLAIHFGGLLTSVLFLIELSNGLDPRGLFQEPSYAGLFMYAISAGFFGVLFLHKSSSKYAFKMLVLGIVFLLLAQTTSSMHVVTFMLTIGLLALLSISIRKSIVYRTSLVLTLMVSLYIAVTLLLTVDYYSSRLVMLGEVNSVSALSWLRGFDQAIAAISKAPVLGLGLGSTGWFAFDSENSYRLAEEGVSFLNLTDAYSLCFRLVIEIGFVTFMVVMYFGFKEVIRFRKSLLNQASNDIYAVYYIYNFAFSVCLLIGVLVKEPAYTNSFIYAGFFLFVSARYVYFRKLEKNAYSTGLR